MNFRSPKRTRRHGATLIDVATGSMLLAVLLIPSIHLISESRSSQRRLQNRDIINFEADQLMDATRVALSDTAAFDAAMASPIDTSRAIVVTDGPDLTGRVRAGADATLSPARLLTIIVDVWHDANRDGRISTGEPSETLRTQWAAP